MSSSGDVDAFGHNNQLTTSLQKNNIRFGSRGAHQPRGSRNKTWVAGGLGPAAHSRSQSKSPVPTSEGRWERGGHMSRGGGRGRGEANDRSFGHGQHRRRNFETLSVMEGNGVDSEEVTMSDVEEIGATEQQSAPAKKTWEELVKAREEERARAIREGKMDDPTKPKRLEDAITIVGTCPDMCPEFERYRRERENNLDRWECIIGPDGKPTKRVDHARAVKIYERGQGDKIIPSDLRPGPVLQRTLDYLFHDLIPRGGFEDTQAFVRDRSRAVRNDFTIQHDTGPIAIECHERCTRFHVLSLHLMYGHASFDRALEIQQLMNSLLSLKEFYDGNRGNFEFPNELEMRIYHRLGLIRDQHERNDKPPPQIASDAAYRLITQFRDEVQEASRPITKVSKLTVSPQAMETFGNLANVLRERGNIVMIYLVACFLEHIFGRDTIEDIEAIRGDLTIQDIIDGVSFPQAEEETFESGDGTLISPEVDEMDAFIDEIPEPQEEESLPSPLKRGATQWLNENFGNAPTPPRATDSTIPQPAANGAHFSASPASSTSLVTPGESVFSKLVSSNPSTSASAPQSVFGSSSQSVFGSGGSSNVFGGPVFGGFSASASAKAPSSSAFTFSEPSKSLQQPLVSELPVPIVNEVQSASVSSSIAPKPFELPKGLFSGPPFGTGSGGTLFGESARNSAKPALLDSSSTLNPSAPVFTPSSSRLSFADAQPLTSVDDEPQAIERTEAAQPILETARSSFSGPLLHFPSPAKSSNFSPSLKINTGAPMLKSNGLLRKAVAIDSPVGPPPLSRQAPISLPSTPTLSQPMPTTPLSDFNRPVFVRTPDQPSPLAIRSSTNFNQLDLGSPLSNARSNKSALSLILTNGNKDPLVPSVSESEPSQFVTKRTKTELQEEADQFIRKGALVSSSFKRWRERLSSIRDWKEACRRSVTYKEKVLDESLRLSQLNKRRRESTAILSESHTRSRRRLSNRPERPELRTDEKLAQRLRENKRDNERRWARGTFVSIIRNHVFTRYGQTPESWRIWLSTNPDNDQTAIWLEQKFDVPNSGEWESETIFSVPVNAGRTSEGFPGLIVFECSPLEGVNDEIERKYRVLDDCTRLRDILNALPTNRHYVPSLLFIKWSDSQESNIPKDILEMVQKSIKKHEIRDFTSLSISSGDVDLDEAFLQALLSINMDARGELVEWLTLHGLFEKFAQIWSDQISLWVTACSAEEFNWILFSHVLETTVADLNEALSNVGRLWTGSTPILSLLPSFPLIQSRDVWAIHQAIRTWLSSPEFDQTYLRESLSASDFNEDFDAKNFVDHLLDLAYLHIEKQMSSSDSRRPIAKSDLSANTTKFGLSMATSQKSLREISKRLPVTPAKRSRPYGHILDSQAASPAPSTSVNGAKRMRLSTSDVSDISSPPSPSPSLAASQTESTTSAVTISMLRELSRNVLKNIGKQKEG